MRRLALACALLAACAPSRATVFDPVDAELARRLGHGAAWDAEGVDPRVPAAVRELLQRPVDLDTAVRIALANSRRLQAELAGLGVAAAAIADATVLAPTAVHLKYKTGGGSSETEVEVVQDVLGLLQLGQRRGAARAGLEAAQARAVAAAVELTAEVERAFVALLAAQAELALRQTAFDTADASAELLERMHAAGNTSDLAVARERLLREETRLALGAAQAAVELAREAVNARLGLSGEATRWTATGALPALPDDAPALDGLEAEAVAASLALAALRADARAAAGEVGIARVRSWLPSLGLGVAAGTDHGQWHTGPAIEVGLPIFDRGEGARARAHAHLARARHELTATAVELRAEARAARQRALEAHAAARHLRDVILPLHAEVLEQTLLQYNAMNASTTELLAARRAQVEAERAALDAHRRYAEAMIDVAALRRGGAPRGVAASGAAMPDAAPAPAAAHGGGH